MTSRNTASVHQKHPPARTATCSAISRSFRSRGAKIGSRCYGYQCPRTRRSVLLVGGLETGKLQPLAHPFGELVEVERLVEHDAGPAILVPAHFALDRP